MGSQRGRGRTRQNCPAEAQGPTWKGLSLGRPVPACEERIAGSQFPYLRAQSPAAAGWGAATSGSPASLPERTCPP